jgi:ankyrin repeat protein
MKTRKQRSRKVHRGGEMGSLLNAIKDDDINDAKYLIENGANLYEEDSEKMTPLLIACRDNNYDIVQLLIDADIDVNKPNSEDITPLVMSSLNNNYDIVKLLIENNVDINQQDSWGYSVLHALTNKKDTDDDITLSIIELLINNGADVNLEVENDKFTPLMHAIENNFTNAAFVLIDNGADINAKNISGDSILLMAARKGNKLIVDKLLEMNGLILDEKTKDAAENGEFKLNIINETIRNFFGLPDRNYPSSVSPNNNGYAEYNNSNDPEIHITPNTDPTDPTNPQGGKRRKTKKRKLNKKRKSMKRR